MRRVGVAALGALLACSGGSEEPENLGSAVDTALAPADVLPSPPPTRIVPGATSGTFSTTAMGSATYSVPITIAPGTAGVEPKLSLVYSSASAGGLAGYGWSLSGLSSIVRCPRTIAQDGVAGRIGYDAGDRFCLDGQRLVEVGSGASGTLSYVEYRTEVETFARVRAFVDSAVAQSANHNPTYWEVRTKAGQTAYYGKTVDARIEAQAAPGSASPGIRSWAISRLEDVKGNYLTVSYTEDSSAGEFYPKKIAYTGNDSVGGQDPEQQAVLFGYEARPDVARGYLAGDAVRTSKRLRTIQSFVSGNLVRDYRLAYDTAILTNRSRLRSIQECTKENQDTVCYAPTAFGYSSPFQSELNGEDMMTVDFTPSAVVGDFDGNGKSDFLDIASGSARVALGTPLGARNVFAAAKTWTTGLPAGGQGVQLVDLNLDGATDLFVVDTLGNGRCLLSNRTDAFVETGGPCATGLGSAPSRVFLAQADNDGLPDAFVVGENGSVSVALGRSTGMFAAPAPWFAALGAGLAADDIHVGDIDGDSRADIFVIRSGALTAWIGEGTTSRAPQTYNLGLGADMNRLRFGDINGDGKLDIVRLVTSAEVASAPALAYLGTGRGFSAAETWLSDVTGSESLIDATGDGLADLVRQDASLVSVWPSSGTAFSASQPWARPSQTPNVSKWMNLAVSKYACDDASVTALDAECKKDGHAGFAGNAKCVDFVSTSINATAQPSGALSYSTWTPSQLPAFQASANCELPVVPGMSLGADPSGALLVTGYGQTDNRSFLPSPFAGRCPGYVMTGMVKPEPLSLTRAAIAWTGGLTWSGPAGGGCFASTVKEVRVQNRLAQGPARVNLICGDGTTSYLLANGPTADTSIDVLGEGPGVAPSAPGANDGYRYAGGAAIVRIESAPGTLKIWGVDKTYTSLNMLSLTLSTSVPVHESVVQSMDCQPPIRPHIADFDGDGRVDFLNVTPGIARLSSSGNPTHSDLLTSVADGLSRTHSISYAYGVDGNTLVKGTKAQYPQADVSALSVVRSVVRSDAGSTFSSTNFTWTGAKIDLQGRGFLGFEGMRSITMVTPDRWVSYNYETRTDYAQTFPFAGAVIGVTARYWPIDGGAPRTALVRRMQLDKKTIAQVGQPTRYVPFVACTDEHAQDRGLTVSRSATRSTYDDWGNLTQSVVTVTDDDTWLGCSSGAPTRGHKTTTTNQYLDADPARWILSRLSSASVTEEEGTSIVTRTSEFEYEPATGLLVRETIEPLDDALRLSTRYGYDAWGHRTTTTTEGKTRNNLNRALALESRVSRVQFDAQGRFPTQSWNALGQLTKNQVDPRTGLVIKEIQPNGLVSSSVYDGFGRKQQETSVDGITTTYTYETNRTRITRPAAVTGRLDPWVFSAVKVTAKRTGSPDSAVYTDARGRTVRKETIGFDGRVIYADTVYDSDDHVIGQSLPYFVGDAPKWTLSTYDESGRLTRVLDPSQGITTYSHVARSTCQVNPKGQVVSVIRDYKGRVASRTEPESGTCEAWVNPRWSVFQYDAASHLTVVDRGARMKYDVRGRLIELQDPDRGLVTYDYDAFNELVRELTPKRAYDVQVRGATYRGEHRAYDLLGRQIEHSDEHTTRRWTFDTCSVGRLCGTKATKSTGSDRLYPTVGSHERVFTYDPVRGYLASDTATMTETPAVGAAAYQTRDTVQYAHDAAGRVDTVTYSNGVSFKYAYTTLGYLKSVADAKAGNVLWQANAQNALQQVTAEQLGNGLTVSRTYDPATTLLRRVATTGTAGAVQDQSFDYDVLGNLAKREDAIAQSAETFDHDSFNRLTAARFTKFQGVAVTDPAAAPPALALTYSTDGNILTKSDVGTLTYGARTQWNVTRRLGIVNGVVVSIPAPPTRTIPHGVGTAGTASYAYDANGNMVAAGTRRIDWTGANMPARITDPATGTTTTFTYGVSGERIVNDATSTVTFSPLSELERRVNRVGSAFQEVESRVALSVNGEPVATVIAKGGIFETRYLHKDHLGSVVTVTNESGKVVDAWSFDAFGKRRAKNGSAIAAPLASGVRRGYTGHEMLDQLSLIHMNGRVYDSSLGRFLSPDSLVQAPYALEGYNRYAYVFNNPLAHTDPSGHKSIFKRFQQAVSRTFSAVDDAVRAVVRNVVEPVVKATVEVAKYAAIAAVVVTAAVIAPTYVAAAAINYAQTGHFNLKATLISGTLMAASMGIAVVFPPAGATLIANVLANGLLSGAVASAQGGDFTTAFAASAFASYAGAAIGAQVGQVANEGVRYATGMLASATVGGVSSVIGGGKFENGAFTAAFNYVAASGISAAAKASGAKSHLDELMEDLERINRNMADPAVLAETSLARNPTRIVWASPSDPAFRNAATPFEMYQDVEIHGNLNGFGFYGDELIASQSITPEQFGAQLMRHPTYGGGPVRLLACEAAGGMAAQRLANTMGVEVLAPTTETYTTFDGRVETVNGGTFVRVVPNYP